MYKQPKVSICVPIHDMKDGDKFLWRLVNSLTEQTFKDWELIITKDGRMAENTNAGIKRARGEYVKIIYLDDYFSNPDALTRMVEFMDVCRNQWLIVGADTNPKPSWTEDIETGNNKLGSPSALMFRNNFGRNLLFDEEMSWLLDCDLYKRLHEIYGEPALFEEVMIRIGQGDHQMTHILSYQEKLAEHKYIRQKHA